MNTGFMILEKKVYQEQNGQVTDDKYVKETIANNKMAVEGYDNGRPIYYVKTLSKSPRKRRKTLSKKTKKPSRRRATK
jgi:hypothetical protein